MKNKFGIAVHGGAGNDSKFIRNHIKEIELGLAEAARVGQQILKKNGSALNAVEAAVMILEDNPFFNAGKGSALNNKGEVEMDASIMDGKNKKAGAISMVRSVRNPISLARKVMEKTSHVMLSGYGALELAINIGLPLEKESYFITENEYETFLKLSKTKSRKEMLDIKMHGTVGAVAFDQKGNLASATSTGGITNCMPGRIGDSCIIGAGCYANNKTCAISATGQGEVIINGVIANTIAMFLELEKLTIQKACEHVIHKRQKEVKGDIGVIGVDKKGNFGICFNTQIMKRAYIGSQQPLIVKIYK